MGWLEHGARFDSRSILITRRRQSADTTIAPFLCFDTTGHRHVGGRAAATSARASVQSHPISCRQQAPVQGRPRYHSTLTSVYKVVAFKERRSPCGALSLARDRSCPASSAVRRTTSTDGLLGLETADARGRTCPTFGKAPRFRLELGYTQPRPRCTDGSRGGYRRCFAFAALSQRRSASSKT